MAQAGRFAPGETELEYVRDPEDLVKDRQRMLGLSADGEALIVVSDQLFVMPRTDILHLEVILGAATVTLVVKDRVNFAPGQPVHLRPDLGKVHLFDHGGMALR
ncbi:hypothetical protein C8J35_11411 [Rhizobium sp. PP-F2F-G38]|uniref:hypothetical protein n=1 Tax=Rhizobium sp. PP-CC-3G-465 TaxID=2135648 RepID=UPI000D83038D|nr:hypothetical protein C8J37_1158 [Rhizobium sp. PP-WC-1G-195]PYE39548.1 hypothetical protein DFI02_12312 [Rhizobium sp. PP-F2F-G20b]PYE93289.1 hypothetical protein C8J35_11411 [Rhizobium sp. PP-F2F-G38]TCL89399.1 hypothetical protein C8J38_11314 [Rhizobium sp. PP-WC-2G-219]TCP77787.1 hypothetical protein C8J31_12312 [Rhizobium sp. PP-CC-2G-626]TCQ01527.1 hypothetical protein C8J34_1304 [Rhizobium sp. PP-F2F-G36]TCQ14505.1 hypothetical protein C8J33_1254 [Rhizobium sp. PP-CC-3G-465]